MNKELLINRVVSILSKAGFIISDRCDIRPRRLAEIAAGMAAAWASAHAQRLWLGLPPQPRTFDFGKLGGPRDGA